jgi:hypothetical protein
VGQKCGTIFVAFEKTVQSKQSTKWTKIRPNQATLALSSTASAKKSTFRLSPSKDPFPSIAQINQSIIVLSPFLSSAENV